MDDKQKSKEYFNRHSSTVVNKNGYWSFDYRITAKELQRRSKLITPFTYMAVGFKKG